MSIQYYYSAVHDDILAAIAEGASAPSLERLIEYSYIPDQTDEDHQEAARVEIHAVRLLRPVHCNYTPDGGWRPRIEYKQVDVIDLLEDEEIAALAAETLAYHEGVMRRARKYAAE